MKQTIAPEKPLRLALALTLIALTLGGCDTTTEEVVRLSSEADQMLREAQEKAGMTKAKRWYSPVDQEPTIPRFLAPPGSEAPQRFVGLLQSGDTRQWISVAAFNSADATKVWEAGPFQVTKHVNLRNRPLLAVSKGNVIIAPTRDDVRLLKGTDGREIRRVELDSKVRAFCPSPGAEQFLFVDLESARHVRLDPTTGATTPMERPEWCPAREPIARPSSTINCQPLQGAARCRETLDDAFDTSLASNSYYVELGDRGVAIGSKSLDVPHNSSIVAYSISEKAVSWQKHLDQRRVVRSALNGDRLHLLLDSTAGTVQLRLAALDPTNGRELWNVELPWSSSPVYGPIIVEGDRIFLARENWLDVLDASNGRSLGSIGVTP